MSKAAAGPELKETLKSFRCLKMSIEAREEALKQELEEDKLTLSYLENEILSELETMGIASLKIANEPGLEAGMAGTFYTLERVTAKVEDAELFFAFVHQNGRDDLLVSRANDTAVKEYVAEAHEPPPGVSMNTTRKLGFRRAQ